MINHLGDSYWWANGSIASSVAILQPNQDQTTAPGLLRGVTHQLDGRFRVVVDLRQAVLGQATMAQGIGVADQFVSY